MIPRKSRYTPSTIVPSSDFFHSNVLQNSLRLLQIYVRIITHVRSYNLQIVAWLTFFRCGLQSQRMRACDSNYPRIVLLGKYFVVVTESLRLPFHGVSLKCTHGINFAYPDLEALWADKGEGTTGSNTPKPTTLPNTHRSNKTGNAK